MMLVYLTNGECIELAQAELAEVDDRSLTCRARSGEVIATFPAAEVESYTTEPSIVAAMKDEICEDLTVISSSGEETVGPVGY